MSLELLPHIPIHYLKPFHPHGTASFRLYDIFHILLRQMIHARSYLS